MAKMVDMELDDEQIGDMQTAAPISLPEAPRYPYGLRLCLNKQDLEKLGLDPSEATVGGCVEGRFMACITSVSMNETEHGEDHRIELQIERLGIDADDDEEAAPDKGRRRSPLYSRKARKEASDAAETE